MRPPDPRLLLLIMALALLPVSAFAQATSVSTQGFWAVANPIIQSVLETLLTAVGVAIVAYLRQHVLGQAQIAAAQAQIAGAHQVQADVAVNQAIAGGASRLAAGLLTEIQRLGLEPASVNLRSAVLAPFASALLEKFPGYAKQIGLTPAGASEFVLNEARKLLIGAGPTTAIAVPIGRPVDPLPVAAPTPAADPAPVAHDPATLERTPL